MSLPNATSILTTLPNGMRAVVIRDDGAVASLAVRTSIHDVGSLSLGGLECDVRTAVWTLVADFDPQIRVGDVLNVDTVPAFVVNAMTTIGNLVSRAQVVLCEDTMTVGGVDVPCHRGMLTQDIETGLGGFLPDDMQGLFVPESILPSEIGDDGESHQIEIVVSTPITISGEQFNVEKVSRDAHHGLLCVTCRRRGDA